MTAFSASICYKMPSWLVSIGDAISWGQTELEFRQWDELMERGATCFLKLDETGVSHGKTWSSQIAFQDSVLSRRNKIKAPQPAASPLCKSNFCRVGSKMGAKSKPVWQEVLTWCSGQYQWGISDCNQNLTSPFPGPPLMRKQFAHFDIHQQTTSTKHGRSPDMPEDVERKSKKKTVWCFDLNRALWAVLITEVAIELPYSLIVVMKWWSLNWWSITCNALSHSCHGRTSPACTFTSTVRRGTICHFLETRRGYFLSRQVAHGTNNSSHTLAVSRQTKDNSAKRTLLRCHNCILYNCTWL